MIQRLWQRRLAQKHSCKKRRTMSGKIIQLKDYIVKEKIKGLVRDSVEETLNKLHGKEAEKLARAGQYEGNEFRHNT